MTTDVFRRVVWKEFRMLRSFWIALVAIVIGAQLIAWLVGTGTGALQANLVIMCTAILAYALGIGATIFAVEREEGTDSFLQPLPVESGQLFTAKVTLAAVSVVALSAALAIVTWAWCGLGLVTVPFVNSQMEAEAIQTTAAGVVCGTFDAFLWGLFFSLLLRRPLVAACVGAAAAVAVMPIILLGGAILRSTVPIFYGEQGAATLAVGGIALVALFAIDWWLGRRWLEGLGLGDVLLRRRRALDANQRSSAVDPAAPYLSPLTSFGRLTWQEFRQARRLMVILLGTGTILTSISVGASHGRPDEVGVAFSLALGIVAIMGSCAFLADQERSQFRYFAERPVRPRMVWLNRHVVWLCVIGVAFVVGVVLWGKGTSGSFNPLWYPADQRNVSGQPTVRASFGGSLDQLPLVGTIAVFTMLAYACGQLCSMLFRSGIVAGFLGLVLTGCVSTWAVTTAGLGINWLIAVAPIPVFMLWVTWLRAPHWIAERVGWWPWTRLGLSLAIPALGIGIATASYRVLQIPRTGPGFEAADYAAEVTPEARRTADMYTRAAELFRTAPPNTMADPVAADTTGGRAEDPAAWQEQFDWLTQNQEPLQLALEATARPTCIFPMASIANDLRLTQISTLARLMVVDAHRLERAGELDGAFDRLLAMLRFSAHLRSHQYVTTSGDQLDEHTLRALRDWWATRPGQSVERLRHALVALESWQHIVPAITDPVEARYCWFEKLLAQDPNTLAEAARDNGKFAATKDRLIFLSKLMPWEAARAQRALNYLTSLAMTRTNLVAKIVKEREPVAQFLLWGWPNEYIERTTPWLSPMQELPAEKPACGWVSCLAHYRATRIALALLAWQLEHGQWPESLHELVGTYLDALPVDPYSGKDYLFFPQGTSNSFAVRHPKGVLIPAGTPFLWGRGPDLFTQRNNFYEDQTIYGPLGKVLGPPQSTPETLAYGWAIVIGPYTPPEQTHENTVEEQMPAEGAPLAPPVGLPAPGGEAPEDAPSGWGGLGGSAEPDDDPLHPRGTWQSPQ